MRCLPAIVLPMLCATLVAQESRPASRPVARDWPSFHGAFGRGVADACPTASSWDVEKGTNVAWKTKIDGLSHSSPVVAGDRIFVNTAVRDGDAELKVGLYGSIAPVEGEGEHEFRVLCLDRNSGKVLWSQTAFRGVPKIKRHPKGSFAASTPATDGKHVAVFFGSEGLHVYDVSGEPRWQKSFGVLSSGYYRMKSAEWGFASSPVIHAGRVYVQADVQENSFVAAFDVATGAELWRTKRDEVPGWGTPTVLPDGEHPQLILNGFKHIGGYDLGSGKPIWWLAGGGDIPVPTPIVAHDLIFITNAHGKMAPIYAISTAAKGELAMDPEACAHMAWSDRRGGNYMQTPLVLGDELYLCHDMGMLSCYDAKTGKRHYRQRLVAGGGTGFTASGIAADGKLYYPSEEGEVHVIRAGKEFAAIGVCPLGETCMASPAASGGTLYFRTRHHLIAIAGG